MNKQNINKRLINMSAGNSMTMHDYALWIELTKSQIINSHDICKNVNHIAQILGMGVYACPIASMRVVPQNSPGV